MIERDLLLDSQTQNGDRSKWYTLTVILMAEFENTPTFTKLVLENGDIADVYKELDEKSSYLRLRKSAQDKFEQFLETLSPEEQKCLNYQSRF